MEDIVQTTVTQCFLRLHQEAEGCAAGVPWRWCVGQIQPRGGACSVYIYYATDTLFNRMVHIDKHAEFMQVINVWLWISSTSGGVSTGCDPVTILCAEM